MRILFACMTLAIFSFTIAAHAMASLGISKEMRAIIESLKNDGELDIENLPRASGATFGKVEESPDVETYNHRIDGRQDAFAYRIYYNKSTREYWIWKTGGIAMVSEYYGPMKLPESP